MLNFTRWKSQRNAPLHDEANSTKIDIRVIILALILTHIAAFVAARTD